MSIVTNRIKRIISENLGIDESRVVESLSFAHDLKADSLDMTELVMSLEEAFDCEIGDDDIEKILTVKDAIDFFQAKQTTHSSVSVRSPSSPHFMKPFNEK